MNIFRTFGVCLVVCLLSLGGCGESRRELWEKARTGDISAYKELKELAGQGDAMAQYNLGVMYATGQGGPQDFVEAYAWFSVAVAGGDGNAVGNRDLAASKLTPDQSSEGQKRVTELLEIYGSGK